jgi:hypothetical protein
MDERRENEKVIERIAEVLDSLGIVYAIGGSMASALYGVVRFTRDADIAIQPFLPVADRFYDLLKDEFYVSREAMDAALKSHGSFNVIHYRTSFKMDLFVQGPDEFEQQLLSRRRKLRLTDAGQQDFCVVSPEDIILLKLLWFQRTGGTSERQWGDIQGVLTVQKEALDYGYLHEFARKLRVVELLQKAITESQIGT